jgi:hypothetical protein
VNKLAKIVPALIEVGSEYGVLHGPQGKVNSSYAGVHELHHFTITLLSHRL